MKNANVDATKYTASPATAVPANQPLKSSAKRKLNAYDEDDQPTTLNEPGKQDFQFSARGSELRMSGNDITKPVLGGAIRITGEKATEAAMRSNFGKDGKNSRDKASGAPATVTATGRKALGPSKCGKPWQTGEYLTILQKV